MLHDNTQFYSKTSVKSQRKIRAIVCQTQHVEEPGNTSCILTNISITR